MSALGFHTTMRSTPMYPMVSAPRPPVIRTNAMMSCTNPLDEAEPLAEPALVEVVESQAVGNKVRKRRRVKVTFPLFNKKRT